MKAIFGNYHERVLAGVFILSLAVLPTCSGGEHSSAAFEFSQLTGDYLGQQPPDTLPRLFAPGVISTLHHQQGGAFSPTGDEFFYCLADAHQSFSVIVFSRRFDGRWSAPAIAPFSGRFSDSDPCFAPDGRKLYFVSQRPVLPGGEPRHDHDLWVVERSDSGWTEPLNLAYPVNTDSDEISISITADRTLYYASSRPGGRGGWDIYRSPWVDGRWLPGENLGPNINTRARDWGPCIAPDESYLVWASDYPAGRGGGDLYVSHRNPDGTWNPARSLGAAVNSPAFEYCPLVSPDGKYLFFSRFGDRIQPERALSYDEFMDAISSPGNGLGDIFWVSSAVLESE